MFVVTRTALRSSLKALSSKDVQPSISGLHALTLCLFMYIIPRYTHMHQGMLTVGQITAGSSLQSVWR